MSSDSLIRKCHDLARVTPETESGPDSLVGFFQVFRPDGNALNDLYCDLEAGDALHQRLGQLFEAAGDDRRPQGGRDAYFLVRNPQPLDPDLAEQLGEQWLSGVLEISKHVDDTATCDALSPIPKVRVLEGTAPKHPREAAQKSNLLLCIQSAAQHVESIDAGPYAETLRPAYYFTACDAMLRDYLMWPLYAEATGLDDPLRPYFELWRHGVKYRIFGESQVDLYLPRHFD